MYSFGGPSGMYLSILTRMLQKLLLSTLTFFVVALVFVKKELGGLHFEFLFLEILIFLCLSSAPFLW